MNSVIRVFNSKMDPSSNGLVNKEELMKITDADFGILYAEAMRRAGRRAADEAPLARPHQGGATSPAPSPRRDTQPPRRHLMAPAARGPPRRL